MRCLYVALAITYIAFTNAIFRILFAFVLGKSKFCVFWVKIE